MEKKQKSRNKKSLKLFSKKAFMGLALAGIMFASPFALAGCAKKGDKGDTGETGANGKDGATWFSGTQYNQAEGAVGDFFYDTDDYRIYRKSEGV